MTHTLSEHDYLPEQRSRYNQYVIHCCSYEEGEELFTVLKDLDVSLRQQRQQTMEQRRIDRMNGKQEKILDITMSHGLNNTVILCTPVPEVNKILYQWANGKRQIKCQSKKYAQKLCQMLHQNGVLDYQTEQIENSKGFLVTCPRSVPATNAILKFQKKYPAMARCVDKQHSGFPLGFIQQVTNLHSM
ncbi:MAG: hypothetical protein IJY58_01165 [Alphaproteobacteria bacterium]|nr:hypothetical protein [Alphaproteobacteria bacterium]